MTREGQENKSVLKSVLFWVGALAIPVVLVLIVEVVLRGFGVGEAGRKPFVPVDGRPEYVVLSSDYAKRYFSGFTPGIAFNPFIPDKPEKTFRVFVCERVSLYLGSTIVR